MVARRQVDRIPFRAKSRRFKKRRRRGQQIQRRQSRKREEQKRQRQRQRRRCPALSDLPQRRRGLCHHLRPRGSPRLRLVRRLQFTRFCHPPALEQATEGRSQERVERRLALPRRRTRRCHLPPHSRRSSQPPCRHRFQGNPRLGKRFRPHSRRYCHRPHPTPHRSDQHLARRQSPRFCHFFSIRAAGKG